MGAELVHVKVDCVVICGPDRGAKKTFTVQLYSGKPKIMRRLARQKARMQIENGQHPALGSLPDSVDIEVEL